MDCAAVSKLGTNAPVSTSRYSRIAILFSAQPTMQRSCDQHDMNRHNISRCQAQGLRAARVAAGADLFCMRRHFTWTAGMGGEKFCCAARIAADLPGGTLCV